MRAARAEWLASLAVRFRCSVPEVRAMTQREVTAMNALLDERARARDRERALADARAQARAGRRR